MEGTYEEGFNAAVSELSSLLTSVIKRHDDGDARFNDVIMHTHLMKTRNFEEPTLGGE